ncbi:MAG: ribbon-helix-helix domain-containing protein [Candidatus Dormibacteraceae bacterium]
MKISVSLSPADVDFIDVYAKRHGSLSRSEVIRVALHALLDKDLVREYGEAFEEVGTLGDDWAGTRERALWDSWVAEKQRIHAAG